MVRTYAYNPSTQSAGLPGSRKPPPELANNNAPPQRVPVNEQRQIQYNGDAMPFMHQVFPPEEPRNLDASLSSGSSLGSSSSSQMISAPRNNNEMPPNDPTPVNYRPPMQLMGQPQLLGYQPAGQIYPGFPIASAVFHASTGNLAYQHGAKPQLSQDALRRSDSMKAFSEFEPAIQRNQVGVPMNTLNPMDSYASSSIPPQDGKSMINELPWARGNPQPKSGKRGSYHWKAAQQSALPSLYQSNDYNSSNRSAYAPPLASNLYNFEKDPYASVNFNPPLPVHLPSLSMTPSTNGYGAFYNDPISAARTNYNPGFPTTMPNRSVGYEPAAPRNDREQHKFDLLQQIEENKRRKQLEEQREREIEERERYRSEVFQARQQAEIDEEIRNQKLKALAAERKAEHIASLNASRMKKPPRSSSSSSISRKSSVRPPSNDMSGPARKLEWWEKKNPYAARSESPVIPALRNKNQNGDAAPSPSPSQSRSSRGQSPAPRASRGQSPARSRNETPQSRRSQSQAPRRNSNASERGNSSRPIARPESRPIHPAPEYQQRQLESSDRELESRNINRNPQDADDLRQLDMTAQHLEDEQQRVSSALRRNDYDSHVFR